MKMLETFEITYYPTGEVITYRGNEVKVDPSLNQIKKLVS